MGLFLQLIAIKFRRLIRSMDGKGPPVIFLPVKISIGQGLTREILKKNSNESGLVHIMGRVADPTPILLPDEPANFHTVSAIGPSF